MTFPEKSLLLGIVVHPKPMLHCLRFDERHVMASVALHDGVVTMHNHGLDVRCVYANRPADYARRCFGDKAGKHGGIITFSAASSRNLKRKLLDLPYEGQGVALYGVTLTIQADAYASVSDPVDTIRKHWQSFIVTMGKQIKAGAFDNRFMFVWRIELTQKGTPHWHCIVCTPQPADVLLFQATWCRLVGKWYGYAPNMDIAAQYCRIDNCSAAFAYVDTHAAKHKRDQLGWKGRQWGAICQTKEAKKFTRSKPSPSKTKKEDIVLK